ncbi:helix-turn-helix transcriptional regulator [Ralstonia nicotianae]|uniref:helix-turn-helix transcriptional regulator n=1 Tax=Ralstonia pseudosolanacearum TaxID=1310165 RepID=UPI00156F2F97|nr:AlpA family transcriptional regulator [Ralstonia solanacearum]QKM23084.1 AlpA family transcriptional regulator [Ralstonia solanacearum]QKM27892.1 AlpA family transcriptional regulator [Ralstonia solanacearum]UZF18568.1 AlpA family transcriptional regulator [Ralstonia solanacearum]
MTAKLLRLPGVLDAVGIKKSCLYEMIRAGKFPAPVRLGARSVAWRQSDVDAWIEARESARPEVS